MDSPPMVNEGFLSTTSLLSLAASVHFGESRSHWWKVISSCLPFCVSLVISDDEHFFIPFVFRGDIPSAPPHFLTESFVLVTELCEYFMNLEDEFLDI